MRLLKLNSRLPLFLAGQLAVAVLLILAVNRLLEPTIEALRTRPSRIASRSDLLRLDSENRALENRIASLHQEALATAEKRLPSVAEIRQLATDRKLGIRRLERVVTSAKGKGQPKMQYSMSLSGQLESNLEALRELDEKFLLECDAITLQRANDDGSLVLLSLMLVVSEG
jgi:hypothetical protein